MASSRVLVYATLVLALLGRSIMAAQPKLVFAHMMVGLTYSFTPADWKRHCQLAASYNIDAFALNVGSDSWQPSQVQAAYDAAVGVTLPNGQPFKLFLSLDMTSIGNNAASVTQWVTRFVPHASSLKLEDSHALVSTFSGETATLGAGSLSTGWQDAVKAPLQGMGIDVAFVPAWTGLSAESAVSGNPVVDGIMPWTAWPTTNSNATVSVDQRFQANAVQNNKYFMATVSPIFSTHFSYKNFIYRSDDNLFISRWKDLLAMNPQPDFIELLTWNDYGESHYLVSDAGTPPAGTDWVDGFDHSSWLDMGRHFIDWFKTGSEPAISTDAAYFNYRTHSVSAVASADPIGKPTSASWSSDNVYASTFLSSSSGVKQIQIVAAGQTSTFPTGPGLQTFSAPFGSGGSVAVNLLDAAGKVVGTGQGSKPISNDIQKYNFNYVSGSVSVGGSSSGASAVSSSAGSSSTGSSSTGSSAASSFAASSATAVSQSSTSSQSSSVLVNRASASPTPTRMLHKKKKRPHHHRHGHSH